MTKEDIFKKVQDNAPYYLYYVDYRDYLTPEHITEIVQTGIIENLYDYRNESETINHILYDIFNPEELEYIREHNLYDDIIELIYENNKSTPLLDLCENTGMSGFLVDLNYNFSYSDKYEERKKDIVEFLESVGIEPTEENIEYVDNILIETYYGGTAYAVIYDNISNFLDNKKNIRIEDLSLLILDSVNGSGFYSEKTISCDIVTSRENIIHEDSINYSFNDVFGFHIDFGGAYELTNDQTTIGTGTTNEDIKKEKEREKKYRETGCAGFSCPKYKYHTCEYKHEPMASGMKCIHCNRLFLD